MAGNNAVYNPYFYHHSPRDICYYLLACSEVCTQPGLALSTSVGSQVPQGQVRSFKGKRFMSSKEATQACAASHSCIISGFPSTSDTLLWGINFPTLTRWWVLLGTHFLVLFRHLLMGFVDLLLTQVCLRPKWRELEQVFGDGAHHARGQVW